MGTGYPSPIPLVSMPMGWMSGASPSQSTPGTPGHQRILNHTYRNSRQSYHYQYCLMGCCMPLMHQFGIRMTQKWELFSHLWTNSFVYLEVIRHHLTQNIFVQAVQVRLLRLYFESLKNLNSLFFFPRFKATSNYGLKGWTSVSQLAVFSLPHPTPQAVWLNNGCFIC